MRKKVFRTLAAALTVASCMTLSAYAEVASVTGSYVNIRSGPGTGYGIVDCVSKGTQLTVTDRSNGSWYAVEYNGNKGFMSSAYLAVTEEVYADIPVYSGPQNAVNGYINAMYVRFRSGPGSHYSVLAEYNKGKVVTITADYGDWMACTIDGRDGFVYSSYLSYGTYSNPQTNYGGGDIYMDSYVPDIYFPVATSAPTFDVGSNEIVVQTPIPVQPEYPVYTPMPTEVHVASPAPTQIPVATPSPVSTQTPVIDADEGSGFINANYVRFRTGPATSYPIIDSYNKGTSLRITGKTGEWTACEINGISGFVCTRYITRTTQAAVSSPVPTAIPVVTPAPTEAPLVTATPTAEPTPLPTPTPFVPSEEKEGYVTGNSVRMREEASMSSRIITELSFGNRVTIIGTVGDWTAVIYDGASGYIYSQYVTEGSFAEPETPGVNNSTEGSELGKQIAEYALQFVGYNYTWGGKSPDTGFDCSGLVYYVYQQFGYTLNRVACDQANNGVGVSDMKPGDILCFYSSGSYIGHVGIYIGNNMFVHAQNSATGVVVSSLDGYYGSRGYEIRRIV